MLSYLHAYHAGNFADLHKHATLCLILQAMTAKETPICYFDTHAGSGLYDLTGPEAAKVGEFQAGVGKLWEAPHLPLPLLELRNVVRSFNPDTHLRYYPGSPLIAQQLLRPQDKLLLLELHPSEHPLLRSHIGRDSRVAIHRRDAHEGVKALLPPTEKRGLVLIDPSWEVKSDYQTIPQAVISAYHSFHQGIYLIWYPLLASYATENLLADLRDSGIRKILRSEIWLRHPEEGGMAGCGLLVINPPWKLEEQWQQMMPALLRLLEPQSPKAGWRVDWLAPESLWSTAESH